MTKYITKNITAAGNIISRKGKLIHAQIGLAGDRVFALRDGGATGTIICKVTCNRDGSRELHTNFATDLHATIESGTTGDINVTYE